MNKHIVMSAKPVTHQAVNALGSIHQEHADCLAGLRHWGDRHNFSVLEKSTRESTVPMRPGVFRCPDLEFRNAHGNRVQARALIVSDSLLEGSPSELDELVNELPDFFGEGARHAIAAGRMVPVLFCQEVPGAFRAFMKTNKTLRLGAVWLAVTPEHVVELGD